MHSVPENFNFKGRVPTRSFDRSIDVGLPTSSQVYLYFVASDDQLS